jgi:hypothetical protein
MTQELQAGFSALTSDASSRYQCAVRFETVDLTPPAVQPVRHFRQPSEPVDGLPLDSDNFHSSGHTHLPPQYSYSSRSSNSPAQAAALNQLITLPNNKGFHFTVSGGYQQVLAARGAIMRDAPFKRKSIVKVPRSEIVEGEGLKPDLKKKLDEIAALTKAHLAILGQSKDTEGQLSVAHGLEMDRNVDMVVSGTYESVEQARVRLLVLLDEMVRCYFWAPHPAKCLPKSGLHSELAEIDYKLHNIIAGRKRSVIQTIQEETGTNIYFPSPLAGVLSGKGTQSQPKQNLIFITGEFFGVQRARDMLYQVSMHKVCYLPNLVRSA